MQNSPLSNDNRTTNNAPCGLLVMDKPQGFTSFDLCAKLRGILHQKHIGHTGTLDPMATGVMVVLLGNAARASELLPEHDKRYTAGFRLGEITDTLDSTGTLLETHTCSAAFADIEKTLADFSGDIMQLPPMYSAVHVGGQRLYKLARQGIEVERTPRPVTISRLELLAYNDSTHEGTLDIECSKGTYIRSLIDDIGRALGCGGIMTSLRRTCASGYTLEQAHTIEEVAQAAADGDIEKLLLPVDGALSSMQRCEISAAQAVRYRNGGGLSLDRLGDFSGSEGERIRVYSDGVFIGIGRIAAAKEPVSGGCALELQPYKRLT